MKSVIGDILSDMIQLSIVLVIVGILVYFVVMKDDDNHNMIIPSEELVKPDIILDTVSIKWKVFNTFEEVDAACKHDFGMRVKPDNMIYGCTLYDRDKKTCIIYASLPKYVDNDYAMEVFGHEALHCFAGSFHKR